MHMNTSKMINDKGNEAENQFIITTEKGTYFKSYSTVIAFVPFGGGKTVLSSAWCYSNTTLKHLKIFLDNRQSKAEYIKDIDAGVYDLVDNLSIE